MAPDPPLYKSHPLYPFRRTIIVNCLVALLLCIAAAINLPSYALMPCILTITCVILSGLLALVDLCIWAHKKHEKDIMRYEQERQQALCRTCSGQVDGNTNAGSDEAAGPATTSAHINIRLMVASSGNDDEDKPSWPLRWIMVLDFLMTGILFWSVFCMIIANLSSFTYYGYSHFGEMYTYYATVPIGYSVVLHARCWWRQLKARQKEEWLKELGVAVDQSGIVCDIENGVRDRNDGHCIHTRHMADLRDADNARLGDVSSTIQNTTALASAIKAKVQALNQEARKALASKTRLPGVPFNNEERQPLLSKNACEVMYDHPARDGFEGCACLPVGHGQVDQPCHNRFCVHSLIHSIWLGGKGSNGSITTSDANQGTMDRPGAELTPVETATTSKSSSTANSTETQEPPKDIEGNDRVCKTSIRYPEAFFGSLLSLEKGEACPIIDTIGDDSDIMVIKKARKSKVKVQKGKQRDVKDEQCN